MGNQSKALSGYDYAPDGFYIEETWVTHRLLQRVPFQGTIYDPCCGIGSIPLTAKKYGYEAYASDLRYRGWGIPCIDFLHGDIDRFRPVENIITNPPFDKSKEFIDRALSVAQRKVAMIQPLKNLAGQRRHKHLYLDRRPNLVLIFADRCSMPPGEALLAGEIERGGGKQDMMWMIWDKENPASETVTDWISRLDMK